MNQTCQSPCRRGPYREAAWDEGLVEEACDPRHILHDVLGLSFEDLGLGGVQPLALQQVDILLLESGAVGGAVHQDPIHLGPGQGSDVLLHGLQGQIPSPDRIAAIRFFQGVVLLSLSFRATALLR